MDDIRRPDLVWTQNDGLDYKPSWKRPDLFLNSEHEVIWEKTKYLPGWQDPADSQKLYEMAYYSGQIILEIGVFGGRSAVVEILGALAANRAEPPQFYGVDIDPGFFERSRNSVQQCGLDSHCLFYHGNLRQFLCDIPIVPSMIFLDGSHEYAGVQSDLRHLRYVVAPGTLILCHDYTGIKEVQRAIDEALLTPFYRLIGVFASSVLLLTTDVCSGEVRGLSSKRFKATREAMIAHYGRVLIDPPASNLHTPVTTLTKNTLPELLAHSSRSSKDKDWPYAASDLTGPLPETLPGGKPWPKISVITASYNQGKYIEETILSVANQNYPNVEHIIMDGASTDETTSILQKHRSRFSYCVSEKDRGQCHAINKGFAKATGDIITWLNSDDMLTPGALAAVAMAFHVSSSDMVAGICQLHRDGQPYGQHLTSCADGLLPLADMLDLEHGWNAGQFFYQPEVFFKRELWLRAGGTLDEKLHVNLDYDLWLRFAKAKAKLKVIGRPLALFRLHDQQKTHDFASFQEEQRQVRDRFIAQNPTLAPKPVPPVSKRKGKLRIVMFNDIGYRYGAGIAHLRLARSMARAGHEVSSIAIANENLDEIFDPASLTDHIIRALKVYVPDVVVLGNLHGASLDVKCLELITSNFPTVFVLHDKWLLTGRCAYSGDCQMNFTGCDESCPTADEYPRLPLSEIKPAWEKKRTLLTTPSQLVLAANSSWSQHQIDVLAAAWSAPEDAPIRQSSTIRFGLPLDTLRPQDKSMCRELLGLPKDKFIVLFSASDVHERRKGMSHLIQAIQCTVIPDLVPVSLGYCDPKGQTVLPGSINLGYIDSPEKLALVYSAADVFVGPSLEEAFGQVFIEAAACGTPSIAYPVGGVPEAVIEGVTGHLATHVEPTALADALFELYSRPELRRNLGHWARIYIENEYSIAASYHSISFALRQALARNGVALDQKIAFPSRPAEPNPVRYLMDIDPLDASVSLRLSIRRWMIARKLERRRKSPPRQWTLKKGMLKHYEHQLARLRTEGTTPWYLNPKTWVVRANRDLLRRDIKQGAPRTSTPEPPIVDLPLAMRQYYRQQLTDYRSGFIPWYLKPMAWLSKFNHDSFKEPKKP